ncbi:MAG: hypothetical protein R3B70_30545 [Polyangiaceae bacterium]
MPITPADRRMLLLVLNPDRPALAQEYVPPPVGCADAIVGDLSGIPQANLKVLLVGARGGGKSSEMREIERRLITGHGLFVSTVDLRASGVSPGRLSAFDLLYMAGLSILCGLPRDDAARALFNELARAYAGDKSPELGSLDENGDRLVSFATAAAAAAALFGAGIKSQGVDIEVAGAAAGAAVTGLGAVGGMILGSRKQGVVPETSTEGRTLLDVCTRIARARRGPSGAHLCIMIDGLEEMNGESDERFRQIFEQTALLSMAPWSAVIAAPPCTLTETKSVEGRGYSTYPVWGFRPEEPERLIQLLDQRCRAAGVDPADESAVEPGALGRIANGAGTLPRHAVYIAQRAVLAMGTSTRLTIEHAEKGLQFFGERLCLPLTTEDIDLLARVDRTGELPGEESAARLFADGRIIVCPPAHGTRVPRWTVHPLILPEVRAARGGRDGPV